MNRVPQQRRSSRRWQRTHCLRRGNAAIAVLLVMVLFALAITTIVVGGAGDHELTSRSIEGIRALYAVEAGANMALRELAVNADEDGDGQIGSIAPLVLAGNAQFTATCQLGDDVAMLTSASRCNVAGRALSVSVQLGGEEETNIPAGIALSSGAGIWGGNRIDSYDSQRGPYGGSNRGSEAVIVSNITTTNGIAMGGGVKIDGEVYCGVGCDPDIVIAPWANPQISGGKHSLESPINLSAVESPTGMPLSSGSINLWGNNSATISSDAVYDTINLPNNSRLYIEGNVRLRITGSLNMSNNAAIELRPGATLDLYLDNGLTLNNNARINANTNDPTRATIHILGNNRTFSTNGNASTHAKVLNPGGNIDLWGGAIFGIVAGNALNMSGGASIHVDVQLTNGSGTGGGSSNGSTGANPFAILSWGETKP